MFYKTLDYPIVIIDQDYDSPRINGILIRALAEELRSDRQRVLSGLTLEDARAGARTYTAASAVLISIDGTEEYSDRFERLTDFVHTERTRRENLPVFLYGERRTVEQLPTQLLNYVHGYIYLYEDTKSFISRQIMRAADAYMAQLLPPFFKALLEHCANSNYSWHTPGHAGGVAFTKSPVGRALHQFFGENTLRSDLSVSVPELGSLLDHTGPIKAAETEAAQNFGADHSFFVTNGTSTANKIVWHGNVTRGDIVFVDRNCHKSLLHSLVMTGAVPVYFTPSRNAHGIIGPISLDQFDPDAMKQAVAAHPLASQAKGDIKLAVVTNSTYDGLCYRATSIVDRIGNTVDTLHFDEAWYAYAAFHEFYAGHYGMAKGKPRASHPLIFTTHSTHKLLAAFSQASMIHVRNSTSRALDVPRFNEAFMMHTSTSPHYGVIASCDIASRMMQGSAGRSLVQEMHDEAISFRRAMLHVERELGNETWWFEVWQPEIVTQALEAAADPAKPEGSSRAEDWTLRPGAKWHGFGELADEYVRIDPIKVTLLMPGLSMDSTMQEVGIPAAIVSKFLWSRGIVVEKTGLYSFLVLFSMGITKGKWSSMITELLNFKRLYDANAPMQQAIPQLVQDQPSYGMKGLRDFCQELHEFYREHNVPAIMREMYTVLPEPVMRPSDAYEQLVRGEVEAIPIDQLQGRIAAAMLVPYPPGIPLIMPGERYAAQADSLQNYVNLAPMQDALFPGFESDIHGLIIETGSAGKSYKVDVLKA